MDVIKNKPDPVKSLDAILQSTDVEELMDLGRALRRLGQTLVSARAERRAERLAPDHPEVRWARAAALANAGRWAEVRTCLDGVNETQFSDEMARHFAHVLGTALLEDGQFEAARETIVCGLSRLGPCELGPLLAMAIPLPPPGSVDPPLPPEAVFGEGVRRLMHRLAAADECLARGDFEGALGVLDYPLVWEAKEVQSSARLARAFLSAGGETPERVLQTLFALTQFAEVYTDRTSDRCELFLREPWSTETLDALIVEATGWIQLWMAAPGKMCVPEGHAQSGGDSAGTGR